MEIYFGANELKDIEKSISREWLEVDGLGNYASSTIFGMNTRRRHGLFALRRDKSAEPLLILSKLHEDFFDGENQQQLFCVEYGGQTILNCSEYQTGFKQDPFPTFIYQINLTQIQKSVFLVQDRKRLIIHYSVRGDLNPGSKLIVRPFFAFRPVNEYSKPDWFVNDEVFLMDNQFRYLPFPDAPEVYMLFSAGQFVNVPLWYHKFYYRNDPTDSLREEDLLNPGFFEIPLQETREIYISMGFEEIDTDTVIHFKQTEEERRSVKTKEENHTQQIHYLGHQLDTFRVKYFDDARIYISELPYKPFNLSVQSFISRKLIRAGVRDESFQKDSKLILGLFEDADVLDILKGEHPEIGADVASPFSLIFYFYEYHTKYNREAPISDTLKIVYEIVNSIYKNRFPFYKIKRNKLLEMNYDVLQSIPRKDHQLFFPIKQNFLINVFWFNVLKIAVHLAAYNNQSAAKYEKHAKKLQKRFFEQYMKSFMENPSGALNDYSFILHPSMIYAITLPFPILDLDQSRTLFKILVKQFMAGKGIKFPVRTNEGKKDVVSPLLLGEYLDAWQMVMKDKEGFAQLFEKIAAGLTADLSEHLLGYFPDVLPGSPVPNGAFYRASGLSTCEVLYFLKRMAEFKDTSTN